MRVHQIAQALTLSAAVAGIGLIAAPASAAEEVFKSRVKIKSITTRVFAGPTGTYYDYLVEGNVRSPRDRCRPNRWVRLIDDAGHHHGRHRTVPRGRFAFVVDQSEQVSSFRVIAPRWFLRNRSVKCEAAKSRRFTFAPPSEAGIAAAPASAAEEVKVARTRVLSQQVPTYGAAPGELYVRGRVRSPAEECERRRRVKVIAGQRGPALDKERADRRGRFFLLWHDQNPPEHYRIKAPRSFRADGSLKCKADVKRIRVPPPPS